MTGFGRGVSGEGGQAVTVEVRSINHRYRDIVMRMPRTLQIYEDDVKAAVASRIARGRIELSVTASGNGQDASCEIEVNVGLLRSYVRALNRLREELGISESLDLSTLMGLKDVLVARPMDPDLEKIKADLMEALKEAMDGLDSMRGSEGMRLEADIQSRLLILEEAVEDIKKRSHGAVEDNLNRFRENLQRLLKESFLDPQRVAQEAAIMADRMDVSEEIVRARIHLKQFRDYMAMDEPVGRKLDFLLQELHREVNTLGVKASDAQVSKAVVEVKAELEKIREQVQNIE
jgi:uncharacterized protein (TIGR00255 family)